jgi:hypothetical protein
MVRTLGGVLGTGFGLVRSYEASGRCLAEFPVPEFTGGIPTPDCGRLREFTGSSNTELPRWECAHFARKALTLRILI